MVTIMLILPCGHPRRLTMDVTGYDGTRSKQAAYIARAFLEPCRMCAAIAEAQEQNDRQENLEAFRVRDRRTEHG